jgi:catechol 2,3-dioxygenase-like lactoylglutathione lyase family enzyme
MSLRPPISALVRAALFVADLDLARAFYGALGLTEVYFEGELSGDNSAGVLKLDPGSTTRCAILKPKGGMNQGMVGLFEVSGPAPDVLPARDGLGPRRGEVALVFYVSDLASSLAAAETHGGQRLTDPVFFEMPHRSQKEVCLRDPDSVLINLVERPVAETTDTRSALDIASTLSPL